MDGGRFLAAISSAALPRVRGLAVLSRVWLRATETEISAAYELRLGEEPLPFFYFNEVIVIFKTKHEATIEARVFYIRQTALRVHRVCFGPAILMFLPILAQNIVALWKFHGDSVDRFHIM